MKKNTSRIILFFLSYIFVCVIGIHAQDVSNKKISMELKDAIPVDAAITIGKLPSGLTYYIRENHKPEKRAELRLAVKAGSLLEDDDQQGLAHFCEHMAFNGTKNFKKQALIDYLESIGMKFGPEVNAYTSFDQTVYMIQVPTDSLHIVKKAFQILEDWAHNVSFDNDEIDKERGVIVEEWRLRRGAQDRMTAKQYPIIFNGSRYADRLPIGKKEIIESFDYETLKRFYKDWYRPDLMAVVAVGDFDKNEIEKLIKEHFSKIKEPANPRKNIETEVPPNKGTLYAIASDKEAPISSIAVYTKFPAKHEKTVADLRASSVESLFGDMLSQRFNEITQKPDAPFAFGGARKGNFVGDLDVFALQGYAVKQNKMAECLDVLLTEYDRVKKFGFTESELERQKSSTLRFYEKFASEKDKTESRLLADEYLRNFLRKEVIPDYGYLFDFNRKYLPTITLGEVNALSKVLMTGENRVVVVSMPEKEGLEVPTETELSDVIKAAELKDIKPYEDKTSDKPLVETEPAGSPVKQAKEINEIGVTEWTLANGVKVVLKPTDFKNDEILFSATSPGGSSLYPDKDYMSASSAPGIVQLSGLGNYSNIQLQKYLAGKLVNVYGYIGELAEGVGGNCSPKDLETMFQLIYLNFTAPRLDSTGFLAYKTQLQSFLENQKASPEKAFQDSTQVVLYDHNFRRRPMNSELLNEINLDRAVKIYKDRFGDAGDFTFFFVGSFDPNTIKPLVEKYLGGLPSKNRNENWKDLGIDYAPGDIEKIVYKGAEPKSYVQMIFSGPFEWSHEKRWELSSMGDVLNIKLREVIREEKGGTYGIRVSVSPEKKPKERYRASIWFGCDPKRVDELTKSVLEQIDSLKNFGPKDIYITKVKETQIRSNEVNMKENRFWLNSLSGSYYYDEDPLLITEADKMTETLTPEIIKDNVKKIFNMKNYIRVILYPEAADKPNQ